MRRSYSIAKYGRLEIASWASRIRRRWNRCTKLGDVLQNRGKFAEAEFIHRQTLDVRKRLARG